MWKYCFLLFAGFALNVLAVPEKMVRLSTRIESGLPVWKTAGIEPLSDTVKEKYAEHSWRFVFERKQMDPAAPKDGKNDFELILIDSDDPSPYLRKTLTWRQTPQEQYTVIGSLGTLDKKYRVFVKSDIGVLYWLKKNLKTDGGDFLPDLFAKALNERDLNDYTLLAAMNILPEYKDECLPSLRKSMGIALSRNQGIRPHFQTLKNIGTPAAAEELKKAFRSDDPKIKLQIYEVMRTKPYRKDVKEIYLGILTQNRNVPENIDVCGTFHWEKEAIPILEDIARKPNTFDEFALTMKTIRQFRSKKAIVPELELTNEIAVLLTRSGDLPGSPKVVSIDRKKAQVEEDLRRKEAERIEPSVRKLVSSDDPEMAVTAALLLWNHPADRYGVSRDYVERLHRAGEMLLRRMKRTNVLNVLNIIVNHVEMQEEADRFSSLRNRL